MSESAGFLEEEGGHKSSKRLYALLLVIPASLIGAASAFAIVWTTVRPSTPPVDLGSLGLFVTGAIGALVSGAWGQQRETS